MIIAATHYIIQVLIFALYKGEAHMPERCCEKRKKYHKAIALGVLFVISFFVLCFGMGLCLTKLPEQKSEFYLAMATQYQEKAETELLPQQTQAYLLQQSYDLMNKAIKQDPYNPALWKNLTLVLAKQNKEDKAIQARDVAMTLGVSDLPMIVGMAPLLSACDIASSEPSSFKTF